MHYGKSTGLSLAQTQTFLAKWEQCILVFSKYTLIWTSSVPRTSQELVFLYSQTPTNKFNYLINPAARFSKLCDCTVTKPNRGLMAYQEYKILSEFSTGEKYTADSQEWKNNSLFTSSSYKPDRNSTVFSLFHCSFLFHFQSCAIWFFHSLNFFFF